MFPVNDALDAILLGGFLFGLIFTLASLLMGLGDVSADGDGASHGADHGLLSGLFNVSSILAFVTWFGGIGYVARNALGLWSWLALVLGLLGGLAGALAVAWFFRKVLRDPNAEMDPMLWEQVGVLARVSSSIRSSGVGEIVYEQNGLRQLASAKGADDTAIPRDTDVVILRIERGIAVVQPFEELLGER